VDAQDHFIPLAEAVLSGTPLYISPAVDNKPPLGTGIHIFILATEQYELVYPLLVGVVNALIAIIIFQHVYQSQSVRQGAVASLLYIGFLPMINADHVGIRVFGMLMLVSAVFKLKRPETRGLALGFGGMFTQYLIFAVPVIMYIQYKENREGFHIWAGKFVFGNAVAVLLTYGSVFVIWGKDSLLNSIEYSIFSVISYTGRVSSYQQASPTTNPISWGGNIFHIFVLLFVITIPATVMFIQFFRRKNTAAYLRNSFLLTLAMAVPFLVRSFPVYWIYVLPWLAIVSSHWYIKKDRIVST
jgi:hypothetical protein